MYLLVCCGYLTMKESRLSLLFVPSAEGGTKEIIMRNQMGKITGNIESIGTEDKSNNERNITYDIMFRAVYYAARRLNSELTKIDNHTNYWEFKKVYSICLCMGMMYQTRKLGQSACTS